MMVSLDWHGGLTKTFIVSGETLLMKLKEYKRETETRRLINTKEMSSGRWR